MSSRYEEVLERIDAFLAELDLLVQQAALQSIQLALTGEPAPERVTLPPEPERPETPTEVRTVGTRRKAAAPAASKQPRVARSTRSPRGRKGASATKKEAKGPRNATAARTKRSTKQLGALAGSTLKYIQRHPGSRMEQIAAGMGVPSRELTLPLRHLKTERRLRTKGQKRATSYFAK
jgi:hypothetical protein